MSTILHILPGFTFGGTERLLIHLSNELQKRHQIYIIFLKGEPDCAPLLHPSIHLEKLELNGSIFGRLRKRIKEINPDIIHTHFGQADFVGLLASLGLGKKTFCTFHNMFIKADWRDLIIRMMYQVLLNVFSRKTTVFGISKSVKHLIDTRILWGKRESILAYNAIPDLDVFDSREQLRAKMGISDSTFVVLFVGRLSHLKSIDTLIESFSLIKQNITSLKVLIVGNGEQKDFLTEKIQSQNLSEVIEMIPAVSEPERFYSMADVFVLPSITEGFGLVIIEAFRSKCAVIATNLEGPAEIIESHKNGILIEPKNVKQLANAILDLYSNPEKRKKIAESGRETYLNRFELSTYVKQIEEVYFGTVKSL